MHPDFKPDTIENDIGVIQFRRPIDYTIYLSPIYALDIDVGISRPYVLGWGQTSDCKSCVSKVFLMFYFYNSRIESKQSA